MGKTYETDYYSWALGQADALKRRSANELDWDHLSEELDALGASEERELNSRFRVLVLHHLKWSLQPERRSRSWENTIQNQRGDIARYLERNPGLKRVEPSEFADGYAKARRDASSEMDMDLALIPAAAPFSLDQAKDENWWP